VRFGTLSINDDKVLMLNGQAVRPEIQGNNSLRILKVFQVDSTDIVIVQDNGGTGCPALYYALTVTSGGARPTKSFGTCSDLAKISQDGNAVIVEMPGFRESPKQHAYRIANGVVSDNIIAPRPGTTVTASPGTATPTFTDPMALVTWLIEHSGRGFDYSNDAATVAVFSPGLRTALRASFARSRQRGEPPCGANDDIILSTQEGGAAQNLRLSAQTTAPDRTTVASSFDVDGYHRDKQFMTVNLGGVWKLENIVEIGEGSLRRSLDCRR